MQTGTSESRIRDWLCSISNSKNNLPLPSPHSPRDSDGDEYNCNSGKRRRKRKRVNPGPLSPPGTISTGASRISDRDRDRDGGRGGGDMTEPTSTSTPSKKRQRRNGDDTDELDFLGTDQTPRAATAPVTEASSQRSSSFVSGASGLSRTSSPNKQLRQMELNASGFSRDKLSSRRLPPPLAELLRDVEDLSAGVGAVAASLRTDITAAQSIFDSSAFRSHVYSDAPSLPTMPIHSVLRIMERANQCELRMEDEASWNMEVHHHIIRAVCRPHGTARLVDFVSCTSAKISSEYRAPLAPAKAIDFCICLDPSRDGASAATNMMAKIDLARATRPGQSINHTDYGPLARMPIVVSIETKRGSENWSQALLQMGVWQAAQLRSLQALRAIDDGDPSSPPREEDAGKCARSEHEDDSLAFYLPGLIIQGHDWSFVLSVRDGTRSALLTKVAIGTTESPLGIYKILAVVARLVRFSEEVYWPAFKADILRNPG